jgi:hypothetical protein
MITLGKDRHVLVNRCVFVPDLNSCAPMGIADNPTRFEHSPNARIRGGKGGSFRYLDPINNDEDVAAVVVKPTSRFVAHRTSILTNRGW